MHMIFKSRNYYKHYIYYKLHIITKKCLHQLIDTVQPQKLLSLIVFHLCDSFSSVVLILIIVNFLYHSDIFIQILNQLSPSTTCLRVVNYLK